MIYHIHLVNGHQLLAEISNMSAYTMEYHCINPMIVNYITGNNGSTYMILRPYLFNFQAEHVGVMIGKGHVVTLFPVDKDFANFYSMSLKHNSDFVNDITKEAMKEVMQSMLSNYIKKSVSDINVELPVGNNTIH